MEAPNGALAPTAADHLSEYAQVVLKYLSAEAPMPSGRRRWFASDYKSLDGVLELEDSFERDGIPTETLSFSDRRELYRDLSLWRAALPFSEAERRLVVDVYRQACGGERTPISIRQAIRNEVVIDAGVPRQVSGHKLMYQWWEWRRGVGQYEGQDGIGQAKDALRRFAGRLVL